MEVTISDPYLDVDGLSQIVLNKIATMEVLPGAKFSFFNADGEPVVVNYVVQVNLTTTDYLIIPMGLVTNQPTWEDTLEGATACLEDIDAR